MTNFSVSYVTIMDDDIWTLSNFYERLFDLKEISLRSEIYRGLDMNGVVLSFSAPPFYDEMGLSRPTTPKSTHEFVTFTTPQQGSVEEYTNRALKLGGSLVKGPYTTYYGAWLSVLRDPSGNLFRICHSELH